MNENGFRNKMNRSCIKIKKLMSKAKIKKVKISQFKCLLCIDFSKITLSEMKLN